MKINFLYIILAGFASGIFFRSFFDFGFSFSVFVIFLGCIIFAFYAGNQLVERKKILIIGLLILSAGFGLLRLGIIDFKKGDLLLDSLVGQKISVEGIVSDEPDVRENNSRLKIKFEEINGREVSRRENMLITVNHYPKYNYGDKIKIKGVLQKPKNFKSDDSKKFDYVSYLAKDNIHYQMFYPEIKFVSSGNGNFIKEKLFAIKNSFLGQIRKIIPEPYSSLLGGLVVGAKESLGKNLQEDFRKTGIIHIVVLSGYNVTIIAEFVMGIFSFLPSMFAMSIGAINIIFFAIMTGASATIVRASIMALFVLLARATGRVNQITRTLFLAGFLMLLQNPTILVFDPSFQLSFMATLGLIVLSPKIEKFFHFIPSKFQLKESLVAVVSTQIFVLPLLLYMMGNFSLVSIPVNLLVLLFIPVTMLFGFLAGVVSFVNVIIALPFAYITYGLLAYELKIVEVFASLPFSSVHITYFPFWLMISVYIIYFVGLNYLKNKDIQKI